jgi:hypothetical protein
MWRQSSRRGRGRPAKDFALILRDRYWALKVRGGLPPGTSLAALERELFPHLKIVKREDGEGYSQPFGLTKVAAGQRGICSDWSVPVVVVKAEARCPGSLAAYRSILWPALFEAFGERGPVTSNGEIAQDLLCRFKPRHYSFLGNWQLSKSGVLRAARLAHRDALGLLLFNCPAFAGINRTTMFARDCVPGAFLRACQKDPDLNAIKEPLAALIQMRIESNFDAGDLSLARAFSTGKSHGLRYAAGGLLRD